MFGSANNRAQVGNDLVIPYAFNFHGVNILQIFPISGCRVYKFADASHCSMRTH